jgi:hypothetical protein
VDNRGLVNRFLRARPTSPFCLSNLEKAARKQRSCHLRHLISPPSTPKSSSPPRSPRSFISLSDLPSLFLRSLAAIYQVVGFAAKPPMKSLALDSWCAPSVHFIFAGCRGPYSVGARDKVRDSIVEFVVVGRNRSVRRGWGWR